MRGYYSQKRQDELFLAVTLLGLLAFGGQGQSTNTTGSSGAGLDVQVKAEDVPLVKDKAGINVVAAIPPGQTSAADGNNAVVNADVLEVLNVSETEFKSQVVGGGVNGSNTVVPDPACGAGYYDQTVGTSTACAVSLSESKNCGCRCKGRARID